MTEEIILVDRQDRQLGFCSKKEAHQKGLLHRAFSVFIVSGGKMLIQKRALQKYHSGGLWANACCSHPRKEESLEQAVERRLWQELGISTGRGTSEERNQPTNGFSFREVFSFYYHHPFSEGLFEHEIDHVFLMEYDGPVRPDPDEIAEVRWVEWEQLFKDLERDPQQFACWFQIAAPRVIQILKSGLPSEVSRNKE